MEKPLKKKKRKIDEGAAADTAAQAAEAPAGKKAKKAKKAALAVEAVEAAEAPAGKKAKKAKRAASAVEAVEAAEAPAGKKAKKAKKAASAVEAVEEPAAEPSEVATPSKAQAGGADSTVFVDGVPYDWSLDQVRDFFVQKCGDVTDVRAPTWQDSGRLRGYAHVSFASAKSKEKALALDGTKVGKKGRYLKIEPAKAVSEGKTVKAEDVEGKRRLFVKNLPYDVSEEDIATLFKTCGKVKEIRIPHNAGRSKGFAYIEFAKSAGLLAAMQLKPPPSLQGRVLHLDADSGSGPKAGFHHRAEAFKSKFGPGSKDRGSKGKGRGKGRGEKLSLF